MAFGFGDKSGLQMMLESFGLDPEKLKAEFKGHADKAINIAQNVERKLISLETKIDMLLAHQHNGMISCELCDEINRRLEIAQHGDNTSNTSAGSRSGGN